MPRFARTGLAVFLLLSTLVACGHRRQRARGGPIVLITLDSLRADVVAGIGGPGGVGGDPELTPHLAELARQASWAGRAIASSSASVPAMASLFTGLRPWQHQAILETGARLSPDLLTLPKVMKSLGYQTIGFASGTWYSGRYGYAQGFDSFEDLGKGWDAAEQLSALTGARQFVWIHLPEPRAPYLRRVWLLPRLYPAAGASLPRLPRLVDSSDLAPYFDPSQPLPAEMRRRFWDMYRLNVAWADERVGRLLEGVRASGQWDKTLLVVVSNHGEEFGEHGQIEHGGNLGRQLLEVPLIIKLPAGSPRRLAAAPNQRVGAARLWATLVEAAGGTSVPAAAPSLFHPSSTAVLSELYLANGSNQFSLLEGDDQLLWESRFAPADPAYFRDRERAIQLASEADQAMPPQALPAGLVTAFSTTPPLHGRGQPLLTLERWDARGGSARVADRQRSARLARELAALWGTFVTEELTPEQASRRWPGGSASPP